MRRILPASIKTIVGIWMSPAATSPALLSFRRHHSFVSRSWKKRPNGLALVGSYPIGRVRP